MTDIENYSELIDEIFEKRITAFDKSKTSTNYILGALNNAAEYKYFKENFVVRIKRLRSIYINDPANLSSIIVKVNEIARKGNWDGAFAELAAYDHLSQDLLNGRNHIYKPIKLDQTIDASKTFASELGQTKTNLDGFIDDFSLYFDVKVFKDVVTEIFKNLFKVIKKHFKEIDFFIYPEYSKETSYQEFELKFNDLLAELKAEIEPSKIFIKSKVIPSLCYRIKWDGGLHVSTSSYQPYEHAMNQHKNVFNYSDKFLKDNACLIVMVVFPWYNQIITDFHHGNIRLYRSMSRRVFCQYMHNKMPYKTLNDAFAGDHTIYEVSQKLSGIIFLEDKSLLGDNPDITNVKSYVYLNPNAVSKLRNSLAFDYLRGLHNTDFDDFEFDNY
jgi:hypothetical protein